MKGGERGRCTAEKCHSFISLHKAYVSVHITVCVDVGVCLKLYFHIGALA